MPHVWLRDGRSIGDFLGPEFTRPKLQGLLRLWGCLPAPIPMVVATCRGYHEGVHRVVILAIAEVVAFDLAIPAQIFGHREERGRYSVSVCAENARVVPSTTGFGLTVDGDLSLLTTADTIIVPGYWPLVDPSPAVCAGLRAAAARGSRIASICVGAFALAAAGLLDGRLAATHWQEAGELQKRFPRVDVRSDVLYIDEGDVLTSAGVAAGIDLCLHMYTLDHGASEAARVSRRMVAPLHRAGGQAQFIERPLPTSPADSAIGDACLWAHGRLSHPLTVASMADYAHMSPRSFARRFRAETGSTPRQWLSHQRVLEACRLLESTRLAVDEVARRSGLGGPDNLRLHVLRQTGRTPTAYRASRLP